MSEQSNAQACKKKGWKECIDCDDLPCGRFASDPDFMANLLAVYRLLNPTDMVMMLDFLGRARHHLPWICPDGSCQIYDDEPRLWSKLQMMRLDPDIGITDWNDLQKITKLAKKNQFVRLFNEVSQWVTKMLVHTLKLWQRHTQTDAYQNKNTDRAVRMVEAGAEYENYGKAPDEFVQNTISKALGVRKAREFQRKANRGNGRSEKK